MEKKISKQRVSKKTNEHTRFKKGVSGNPAGRPKRTTNVEELRQQILTGTPELINHLFAQAYQGDLQAAKLLLERVLPVVKPQSAPIAIQIPEGDIASQVQFLFRAASLGQISMESATELAHIAQIALSVRGDTAIDLPLEEDLEIDHAAYCSHTPYPPNLISESGITVTEMAQHRPEQAPIEKANPTPAKENRS